MKANILFLSLFYISSVTDTTKADNNRTIHTDAPEVKRSFENIIIDDKPYRITIKNTTKTESNESISSSIINYSINDGISFLMEDNISSMIDFSQANNLHDEQYRTSGTFLKKNEEWTFAIKYYYAEISNTNLERCIKYLIVGKGKFGSIDTLPKIPTHDAAFNDDIELVTNDLGTCVFIEMEKFLVEIKPKLN